MKIGKTPNRSVKKAVALEGEKMKTRRNLCIEDYHRYYKNPLATRLTIVQLNQVFHMHGFMKVDKKRQKVLEALDGFDHTMLMNPIRSSLSDTSSSPHLPLSMDQVNDDLDSLRWRDDHHNAAFTLQSLNSFSFSNDHTQLQITTCGKRKRKRKRLRKPKPKPRKVVFNPVYKTKPRSKKNVQKRKSLADWGVTHCTSISSSLCNQGCAC
ncbi:uncharacterized protein LOC110738200 [Chenopodium quinoa]|uniref:uncharacterized protein LOC110738200 n=1 Tax=Chenopodium quinoa TaxID=63459 RepID=UPI000B784661|nr:uncharacterized protein LOC110738200 [Chenopodium quinoa]